MKENKKVLERNERGITLIALVITIIVLLILAGVSIAMLTGQNGILTQAQNAKNRTEEAQANEESVLDNYEQYIEGSTNGGTLTTVSGNETTNTTVYDSLGNKIVVPAGFKVVNPGNNVEDGIIIVDSDENRATYGSEFVWIPVGENIKKKDGTTFDIILGRYVYKEDGTIDTSLSKIEPTGQLKKSASDSYYFTEGLNDSSTINTHAKDIANFISQVKVTGGYYIARYEARDGSTETARTDTTNDKNQITVVQNSYVYNYVTQSQAASLSQEMYAENSNFISDLMNSYAWDTAIDFIQKCDNRTDEFTPYSRQIRITSTFMPKGTNNLDTKDVACNIFDMASNCFEWTTETSSYPGNPCVRRGGYYNDSIYYASSRTGGGMSLSGDGDSFRPILYLQN